MYKFGLPTWLSARESTWQCRRHTRSGFDPWVGKIPWRRAWQPTPVFLPGESHGQRSLAGYSWWGHRELDTIKHAQYYFIYVLVSLVSSQCIVFVFKQLIPLNMHFCILVSFFTWYILDVFHAAYSLKASFSGNSLSVQWLECCTSTSRGVGMIPFWGTKIQHGTPKQNQKRHHLHCWCYLVGECTWSRTRISGSERLH